MGGRLSSGEHNPRHYVPDLSGNYVEELRNLYEGARDDFIAGIQEEDQQGRKTLVQVNPSYGCALLPVQRRHALSRLARAAKSRRDVSVSRAEVARIALAFPGAREGITHGKPAWRIGKKFFTWIRDEVDSLVVHLEFDRRARHAHRE